MGRGVMTCSDAIEIVYLQHDSSELWEWEDVLDWIQETIEARYKSFDRCDKWDGGEEHRILENGLANVVVCEYCDMISINLVPDPANKEREGMADNWCRIIAKGFRELFPGRLVPICTASNGETFYKRAEA